MAHETAARWCGKKDWGDARPRPYWVESCPYASLVDLSSTWRRRMTSGVRAPQSSGLRREEVCDVTLCERYVNASA